MSRQAYTRLDEAMGASHSPIFIVDGSREIVDANVAAVDLLAPGGTRLVGRSLDDVLAAPGPAELARLQSEMRDGGWTAGTWDIELPDGRGHRVSFVAQGHVAPDHHLVLVHHRGEATPAPHRERSITRRERQILELVARGSGTDEIATDLAIGGETVRTHIRRAVRKLGARNRTHAVAIAIHRGLIGSAAT